jgi:hypothetical protein
MCHDRFGQVGHVLLTNPYDLILTQPACLFDLALFDLTLTRMAQAVLLQAGTESVCDSSVCRVVVSG